MARYTVTLEESSEDVLKRGLKEAGHDLSEFSDEEIGNMLTYAIGYVDYTDPLVIKELLENK